MKKDFIFGHIQSKTSDQIREELFQLGSKNCAPTNEQQSFHEFGVYLYPFFEQKLFSIGETIGGGHGGTGKSSRYSIDQLVKVESWKTHFSNSGCSWAVGIIENHSGETTELVKKLFLEKQRQIVLDQS